MALGRRKSERQGELWIATQDVPRSAGIRPARAKPVRSWLSGRGFRSYSVRQVSAIRAG